MKARYQVHSVGPYQQTVETALPDGTKGPATIRGTALELVSETPDHGTIKLVSWSDAPFQVGDTVEATFEKVV